MKGANMRNALIAVSLLLFAGLAVTAGHTANMKEVFTKTGTYTVTDGENLYLQNCEGCHMAGGKGAKGAGMYPALAGNSKATPEYVSYIVLFGLRGMPSMEPYFSDEQVAAVSNYVATHFGNKSRTELKAVDIKELRPAAPVEYLDW